MLDTAGIAIQLKLSESDPSPPHQHHMKVPVLRQLLQAQTVELRWDSHYCICKHFNFQVKLVIETLLKYYYEGTACAGL